MHESFKFRWSPIYLLCFVVHTFVVIYKKSLTTKSNVIKLSSMFFSKNFIILAFTFRSLIHYSFWVNFLHAEGKGSSSFFYMWLSSCPRPTSWKDPIKWSWYLCWNSLDHICEGLFWTFCCVPYYSSVTSLKSGRVTSSSMFFLKIMLAIQLAIPLSTHINFGIHFTVILNYTEPVGHLE